ncbi:flagellar protein FlaG [Helicobacter sp. T3_23-1059]
MAELNTSQVSTIRDTLYNMASSAGEARGVDTVRASNLRAASAQQDERRKIQHEEVAHTKQDLVNLSKEMNQKMRDIGTDINFSYSEDIRGLVVTVKEPNSGKVIREIPSQDAIELARKMNETMGLLFDKES